MDGDGDYRAADKGPKQKSGVTQLPPEYDDFQLGSGSASYSQDINRRMKVPDRLSVDGKNLNDLEIDNMRANASSSHYMKAAGMAVPDKITVVGSGVRDPLDDDYSQLMNDSFSRNTYVNINTPPRVLTVEERFPAVDEDEENGEDVLLVEKPATPRSLSKKPKYDPDTAPDDEHVVEYGYGKENRTVEQRLRKLEVSEQQRQTRELILYPLIAVYLLFKLGNWLLSR